MSPEQEQKEVLYVWPYLDWGGAQIYFAGLMKHARERYAVSAVMPEGSAETLLRYMQQLSVPVEFFESSWDMSPASTILGKVRRRWRKASTEWEIARYLNSRGNRNAILHVDLGPWQSFWLLLYLSLRSHVLVTLHTALPPIAMFRRLQWKAKFRILLGMSKFHLLASNRDMVESLRPYVPSLKLQHVRIAYSGVDTAEMERALAMKLDAGDILSRVGLPSNRFFVFSMGQFIDRKGCWVLLDTAKQLAKLDPSLCFVWLGTRPLDQETAQRIEELGLSDTFHYLSSEQIGSGRTELLSLLRMADLFVLPSFTEGLPVALLEAMALGVPCIASNVNAIPEAITEGETGILVPPGDSNALVDAILKLKKDDELRARIGGAARERALHSFDERETARITIEVYDACSNSESHGDSGADR